MKANVSLKIPDGKMVKINAEIDDEKILDTEIRGDFFLEPPEKLQELEEKISGIDRNCSKEKIQEKLEEVDAELIGFSRQDVAEALRKAADKVEGEEK